MAAGDLGQVPIECWSQHGITMAERVRVAIGQALERATVVEIKPALGNRPFPGGLAQTVLAEKLRVGEVFAEVNGAGPVLGAGKHPGFDDDDRHLGLGEGDRRRDPGGTGAHDDDIINSLSHPG